jgi:Kef-type K+ transport system membrane component KefB
MESISDIFKLPLNQPTPTFLVILLIILLSWAMYKKFKIPTIISLIVMGVVIGQYGLHLVEKNSAINLFSTIGLLYILFIAGLELDLDKFKQFRHKSLIFGCYTFSIPLIISLPICYYFLKYDFDASLLISSMFATHTLVAYPIVSRLGVAKNQAVAITVGGTILTDTLVLILLAVIVKNKQGVLGYEFWVSLIISLLVFSFIMLKIIPIVTKWFFQFFEQEAYAHYIYLLAIVFFASILAQIAGLDAIIGAFFSGLALNRFVSSNHKLMEQVEFIGNALFIPFFLISVGMIVNVPLIFSGFRTLIIAIFLSVIALIGKWVAAFVTQKTLGYSVAQRKVIFGLSSSHAAATLAIILVGFNNHIIGDYILNGTILLILVTCMVASIVTEKAAPQLL